MSSSEAKQFEKDFLEQHSGSTNISFENLTKNYLNDCVQRIKATTMRQKKFHFKTYILPYFSAFHVSEITPLHVRNWQNEILAKGFKPTFQRTIHVQLSAVLNYAVRYYGLKRNPAALAGSIGALKPSEKMQFYTLNQFQQFLPCVREQFRLPFKILFYTGLRVGEMLALTLADFDADAGTFNVNKTLDVKTLTAQPPKTPKSNRIVTLPQFLIQEIKDYINERFYDPQPWIRLFFWFRYVTLVHENWRAADAAGLPRIRIHDFRHSHASLLINLDFPPLVVSDRLGHEDIKTTLQIYSHLYPDKTVSIAEKLQDFQV